MESSAVLCWIPERGAPTLHQHSSIALENHPFVRSWGRLKWWCSRPTLSFHLDTEVTKDRSNLLSLENPKYREKINWFAHLRVITMDDTDEKAASSTFTLRSRRICQDQDSYQATDRATRRSYCRTNSIWLDHDVPCESISPDQYVSDTEFICWLRTPLQTGCVGP